MIDNCTERLLTVAEVAAWLNVSEGTIRYWRHIHRGPPSLTVGFAVRYRRAEVEEWLAARGRRGGR